MKKLFFVFFIMFLTFGDLGSNIESSITSNEHVQQIPNIATAATIVEYDVAEPEKRFYWGGEIMPMLELSNADNKKQIMCMAKNIFFEAATESTAGQLAVTQVVLNRVKSKYYPNTVCGVIQAAGGWCRSRVIGSRGGQRVLREAAEERGGRVLDLVEGVAYVFEGGEVGRRRTWLGSGLGLG